jgi:type IV pilus assembly protein PilV
MVATKAYQSGMALLEALIGILIFSLGILAMVAMQAASVNAVADAQYRIEAVNAANHLLAQMWVDVNRTDSASVQASLLAFEHQTSGTPDSCAFDGDAATSAAVTAWLNYLNTGGPGGRPLLPGATAAMQQVQIDTGASNRVTITLCWRAPNDTAPHRHTVVAYVN